MVGATVEVYSAGIKVATATTDSTGKYTTSALLAGGPYVIKATLDGKSLYSVQAKGEEARVNVTPHTNLIAALLSPSGNAENLSTEIKSDKAVATEDKIGSKKEIVKNIISPVTKVLEVTSVDPISSKISANGQGYDRALLIQLMSLPSLSMCTQWLTMAAQKFLFILGPYCRMEHIGFSFLI
jgi:hypothetical protein